MAFGGRIAGFLAAYRMVMGFLLHVYARWGSLSSKLMNPPIVPLQGLERAVAYHTEGRLVQWEGFGVGITSLILPLPPPSDGSPA